MIDMNQQFEFGAVGALLNDNQFMVESGLHTEAFSNDIAKALWKAASDAINSGNPVDGFELMNLIPSDAWEYISFCKESSWSKSMSLIHAKKILEKHENKKVIEIGQHLTQNPNQVAEVISQLMSVNQKGTSDSASLQTVLSDAMTHMDQVAKGEIKPITTGLEKLDKALGGFHKGDLVIVAARPAMGKTSLLLNMLNRCNVCAGFFSLEMGRIQIGQRMMTIHSGVTGEDIRRGKLNDQSFAMLINSMNQMRDLPIQIYDKPAPLLSEVIRQARKWILENKVEIIFLDYLQRIKVSGNEPRHEKVGESARTLKTLASELQIPIVVLAQVNRSAEGLRPNMSHLAQSGEIEAESDQIIFLYKDKETPGIAELLIAKNRHGQTGAVRVQWNAQAMQFNNLAYGDDYA